jgi:hypothetical protein
MKYCVVTLFVVGAAAFAAANHLLLTEVCVTPSNSEFIEIYNPTSAAISLDDTHLTDLYGTGATVADFYPGLELGPVTEVSTDFICMFPYGYSIGAGDYIVIALAGNSFFNEFGFSADFDVRGQGGGAVPMAFHENGYCGPSGGLTNSDEVVVLFHYTDNGDSDDLCYDLDYAMWGDETVKRVDKTGIVIGTLNYLADTAPASQSAIAGTGHGTDYSFQRVDLSEGTETLSGGNGYTGHNETSENLSVTWTTAIATPGGSFTALNRETWAAIKTVF